MTTVAPGPVAAAPALAHPVAGPPPRAAARGRRVVVALSLLLLGLALVPVVALDAFAARARSGDRIESLHFTDDGRFLVVHRREAQASRLELLELANPLDVLFGARVARSLRLERCRVVRASAPDRIFVVSCEREDAPGEGVSSCVSLESGDVAPLGTFVLLRASLEGGLLVTAQHRDGDPDEPIVAVVRRLSEPRDVLWEVGSAWLTFDLSPDGRTLATPGRDGIDLHDARTGELRREVLTTEEIPVARLAFDAEGGLWVQPRRARGDREHFASHLEWIGNDPEDPPRRIGVEAGQRLVGTVRRGRWVLTEADESTGFYWWVCDREGWVLAEHRGLSLAVSPGGDWLAKAEVSGELALVRLRAPAWSGSGER